MLTARTYEYFLVELKNILDGVTTLEKIVSTLQMLAPTKLTCNVIATYYDKTPFTGN